MSLNRWHMIAVATLLLGSGWLWMSRMPAAAVVLRADPQPAAGHPAPDFTLPTLDGDTFVLSEMRGTPVVLNFWATWCGPCRRELPALQTAAATYAGRVEIIGVDQGEDPATIQEYVDELGLTFAIPLDADYEVGDRYNVRGLPTTFFIDRNGVIVDVWSGEMNSVILAEHIRQIYP